MAVNDDQVTRSRASSNPVTYPVPPYPDTAALRDTPDSVAFSASSVTAANASRDSSRSMARSACRARLRWWLARLLSIPIPSTRVHHAVP